MCYVEDPYAIDDDDVDRRFVKRDDWAHEKEWRICAEGIVRPNDDGFLIPMPEAITNIHIGPKFDRAGLDPLIDAIAKLRVRTRGGRGHRVCIKQHIPPRTAGIPQVLPDQAARITRRFDVFTKGDWDLGDEVG